ncbi:MAG: hypothetical protein IPP71_05110 [Bacteroidetes bacterium]|nr:hypothetical protein [Bacteroidota bacterium]
MYFKSLLKFGVSLGFAIPVIGLVMAGSPKITSDYRYASFDQAGSSMEMPPDSGKKDSIKLPYPWKDNLTDPLSNKPSESPMYLADPSNIQMGIDYDPEENQYNINEKMGDMFYRNPTYLTFDEFVRSEYSKSTKNYWKEISENSSETQKKSIIPKIYVGGQAFDRILVGTRLIYVLKGQRS